MLVEDLSRFGTPAKDEAQLNFLAAPPIAAPQVVAVPTEEAVLALEVMEPTNCGFAIAPSKKGAVSTALPVERTIVSDNGVTC